MLTPFRLWLCAALAAFLTLATAAQAAPALWVVKSPTATIYLFGTIHVLEADVSWRTPALDDAYAKAADIWFEMDVGGVVSPDGAKDLRAMVMKLGLDAGHPLSGQLDPEHLGELKALMEHDQLPFDAINVMRPWMAALLVSEAPMIKAGAHGAHVPSGADLTLSDAAVSDKKSMRFFETASQQLHFFADLSQQTQLQLLEDTIDELAQPKAASESIEAAWVSGDLVKLGPLMLGHMQTRYPELYEALITRRNAAWVDLLTQELATGKVELVNVGALHMVGDAGLPALLKARGFAVERLQ
jgi:uncharacterized protein